MSDIDKLDEYFEEYKKIYPDFVPYTSKENYNEFLKTLNDKKQGIGNNGIKEIFYYAIEDNKIVGHGSIRLNPETDEQTYLESGHIMYGVVPSKRRKGYGFEICKLLLEEANKLGLKNVIITCNEKNIGSKKIIEKANGTFIEKVSINNEPIIRYNVSTTLR